MAWETVEDIPMVSSTREQVVLLVVGPPVFLGISYLSLFTDLALPAVFLANAALLTGVVLAPIPVIRWA